MKPQKSTYSLVSLLVAQTQVVFNDNSAKFMLMALAPFILSTDRAGKVTSLIPALLVLPFILFAPIVGWVSDRYSKRAILNIDLLFQVFGMLLLCFTIWNRSFIGSIFVFFLLAIQACLFSPAKQGILKEIVGPSRLGMAVGWMEMLTISAILSGTYFGGRFFDFETKTSGDPWKGALWTVAILSGGSILSWFIFQGVEKTEPQSKEPFRWNLTWQHFVQLRDLWRLKPLRLAALGSAYFYSLGGALYLAFIQLGRELNEGQIGSATESGTMLVILGGGIICGSLLAALFCKRSIELGLVPIGGVGISATMLMLGASSAKSSLFYAGLVMLGIFGGLFTVPLNAFLQARARDEQRGRVLAAANLITNIGGIGAVGVYYVLGSIFHLTAPQQFLVFLLPTATVAMYVIWLLPESLLRLAFVIVGRCFYRVRSQGVENLPKGGALLICNHVSYVDALILQIACPRPIRFIAYEAFHKNFWIGWVLKILGVIPISKTHAKNAIREAAQKMREGELVCVFPEGEITRTGTLQGIRKGFELMAHQAEVPVVPVFMDRLWGSIFSFSERKYVWKIPKYLPYPILVNFGIPMPHTQVNSTKARQVLLDEGEESFSKREELTGSIGAACIRTLSKRPWHEFLVDFVPTRRAFSRGTVLALAILLSKKWKLSFPQKRIGVVLPPGIAGTIVNLALVFMRKTPVNLNCTAGRLAIESCLKRAEIDTVITANALKVRLPDFPWPENTIDIAQEIETFGKGSIVKWLVVIYCLPSKVLTKILGVSEEGGDKEAALLFTSGSYGEPKGVVLTHRNILANISQIEAIGALEENDSLLSCLPLFHSFGFTVTLWGPLLLGVRMVAITSPLEVKKIASAIEEEKATVLMGTPTFYRPYLRKVEPAALKSVRLIVAGAEKLPQDLSNAFEERFGVKIHEGYGLTETTAVVSVCLPDPPITTRTAGPQVGDRPGSVGRLLPGLTARIIDPDTGAEKSLTETGILYLKGASVFDGYLNDQERSKQVLKDGWFVTGDLARFDEDGFLFIEGRLSRFSKIAGEMVPHGTVEQKIIQLFGLETAETQPLVITGVPDGLKGEALVLLTTIDISMETLRAKLSEAGIPNLWVPKIIKRVDKIPTLGTGKLDLKACEKLASEKSVSIKPEPVEV
jgi:acyl-[acyl-carrier-protein]-phospholipid O-acyltransferase/long-chain-fatty-acid--[acyl-carrier-protein] ligase